MKYIPISELLVFFGLAISYVLLTIVFTKSRWQSTQEAQFAHEAEAADGETRMKRIFDSIDDIASLFDAT